MKNSLRISVWSVTVFVVLVLPAALTAQTSALNTLILDKDMLQQIQNGYVTKEMAYQQVVKKMLNESNKLLNEKPLSVVDKSVVPPSGDKHDFLSMAPYFWPDPTKTNGLPYIQRDGERNPEIYAITDKDYLSKTLDASQLLAITYFVTGDSKYSTKSAEMIRVWFLNEATKMNPNMKHAQFIRGINEGRGTGLISSHDLYKALDAVLLLRRSKEWTRTDDQNFRKWFDEYFTWLTTHPYGKDESGRENNHGTWYDVQAASIALFLGKDEFAKNLLEMVKEKRITPQIESDGKLPNELRRTRSWHYSCMNLCAFMHLALLGEHVHVDLWNYQSKQGGSIRKAVDYLLPFVSDSSKWGYKQITPFQSESESVWFLHMAEKKYDKKMYRSDWLKKISSDKNTISVYDLFY
ncbi:MAG: alginate lyase family protein [Ignavibacteriales bacterium]|nr:alginate lyase family protein [Ignavibacteriales bacterium]